MTTTGNLSWMTGAVALMLAGGCASTYQARHAEPAGFLGDYSMLRKGRAGQALLIYVKPGLDYSQYHGLLMDPVGIYVSQANSKLGRVSQEDQQRLVNYLDSKVRTLLAQDYRLVDKPGPNVVRLRLAITEARGANVALDTVSTLVPVGLAISEAKNLALGSHSAVGAAGLEGEVLDAQTGERLAAFVDRRVGRKVTGRFDKFKKWRTADDAFDVWAETVRERLRAPLRQP